MKIILASKSPRRKKILEDHGYDFTVEVSEFSEDSIKAKNVTELVLEIAKNKAETIARKYGYDNADITNDEKICDTKSNDTKSNDTKSKDKQANNIKVNNAIIIAADTLVYFEGKKIGQPKDEAEAEKIIKKLLGKTHEVYTGICVINTANGVMLQDYEMSEVRLKQVDDETLQKYIESGQYKGKAGGYDIGDLEFISFIDKIKGSKDNIIGLPFEKLDYMVKLIKDENLLKKAIKQSQRV